MSMTYYAVTNDPNELAHFGIPGMKWGVRHDKPRHSGSRGRSAAYKKAQSKLGKMMKSGIRKAQANWKAYNSPQAKEKRFMDKAMQKARTGTLKYGKLTDDQVRRVTERLNLERQARQLGSTENPTYAKRLKSAIGEGIIRGFGQGTASYIDARMRGRGETTAAIKKDKRMAKYESDREVQRLKARNKVNREYEEEAAARGVLNKRGHQKGVYNDADRAKQLKAWKQNDVIEEERVKRQRALHEAYDRTYAAKNAEYNISLRNQRRNTLYGRTINTTGGGTNNNGNNGNNNGPGKGQLPVVINIGKAPKKYKYHRNGRP